MDNNSYSLQSPIAAACGKYCMFYLTHICKGVTLRCILGNFDGNVDSNGREVYDYVRYHFNIEHTTRIYAKHMVLLVNKIAYDLCNVCQIGFHKSGAAQCVHDGLGLLVPYISNDVIIEIDEEEITNDILAE